MPFHPRRFTVTSVARHYEVRADPTPHLPYGRDISVLVHDLTLTGVENGTNKADVLTLHVDDPLPLDVAYGTEHLLTLTPITPENTAA